MSTGQDVRRRSTVGVALGTTTSLALRKFQVEVEVKQRLGTISASEPTTVKAAYDLLQAVINSSPGSYPGDDGSPEICERYNFYAHGKRFLFSPCSLGYFPESSRFRQMVIWCITWKRFDQFILLLIFANSIILALADYSKVDAAGDLDTTRSSRNAVVTYADRIFTALFSVECTMKIIAMGLFGEKGAYLMDPWNWMDFAVVFIGILAVIPGIPNVSVLRTFRVLRPLRSLNAVAGMKKLVTSLLKSIPELLTVVAFLLFLFFLYGVIGVQLWSGVLHPRCRLTPYPIRLDANVTYETLPAYRDMVLANYSHFACLDEYANPIPVADSAWSHESSPWKTPRMCFWPIADESPKQTCSLGQEQHRICPVGQTCGSNFDSYGNFRFTHPDAAITRYELQSATYTSDMSWGFANFDNIAMASLAIFQCITREGWSDIMYMLQDAGYGLSAVCFFVSFIIIGSFFMLNLTLAVIWENFSEASFIEAEELKLKVAAAEKKKLKEDAVQLAARASAPTPYRTTTQSMRVRAFFASIVHHWLFHTFRTALIVLNTIILSLDKYPIDDDLDETVELINFGLTLAFLTEVVFKLVGLGLGRWAKDRYNLFDALVVLLSVFELVLSPPKLLTGAKKVTQKSKTASFSGLRSVRLFALFKLARSWPSLQKLLATMLSTIKEVGNFSVLLLVFMYIYALIGMQTFANQFRFDAHGYPVDSDYEGAYIPRSNFDTLLWSMVTVFQILTGENWNVVMMDGWRSSGWTAVVYFISLVVLGNFIVLNLFLAILLGNFEESFDDEKKDAREEMMKKRSRVAPATSRRSEHESTGRGLHHQLGHSESERLNLQGTSATTTTLVQAFHASSGKSRREGTAPPSKIFQDQSTSSQRLARERREIPEKLTGRSLLVFSLRNPIRKLATKIILHPHFDNVSLLLVAVSTVALAIDNPLSPPESTFVYILSWLDMVLTGLFVFEVSVKIIALGFVLDKHAYLRNSWNVIDFVITALAAFSLSEGSTRFKFVKTLRTFRALRPLRMINRNPGLKLVVSSLIASIPQIVNVIVVCLLVFTIFSILAVNNLKGKLYSCGGPAFDALDAMQQALITTPRLWTDLSPDERAWFNATAAATYAATASTDALTSKLVCTLLGAQWRQTIHQSFDNVLLGCQAFFEMTTTEGWITVMLAGVDATEIDMQPIPNYREGWAFFFIAFILVGTFFVMQLFVGVVIENFNKMKEKLDGTYLLSNTQREWLIINDAMLHLRPMRKLRAPQHKARRVCFRLARSPSFEVAAMGCITLNTLVMAMHYFGEDDVYGLAIEYSNHVFAVIFLVEAAVKLTGLGRYYWKDRWNVFDFAVVTISALGMVYSWAGGSATGPLGMTLRGIRAARLIRLVQSAPALRQLFNTLMATLPSLVNIGGLLFLIFFIYAAMGVQLFAKVKFGELVTDTANFQTIARAMVTLIRCATGERWNDLMFELTSQENCVEDPPYDPAMCGFNNTAGCVAINGCGSPVAIFYLYSFTLLVSFILLNIFIAVILEGFANEKDRMDGLLLPHNYTNFVETWSLFDPEATGFLEWHVLPDFLAELEPPMGLGKNPMPTSKELMCLIEILDLPVFRGNKVFFNDVARRMGKFVVDELSEEPLEVLPATLNLEQRWRKYLLHRNVRKQDQTMFRVNQFHAASFIHKSVKALMLRDDLRQQVDKFVAKRDVARQRSPVVRIEPRSRDQDGENDDSDSSSDFSIFDAIH